LKTVPGIPLPIRVALYNQFLREATQA